MLVVGELWTVTPKIGIYVYNCNRLKFLMAIALFLFGSTGCERKMQVGEIAPTVVDFHLANADQSRFDWPYSGDEFVVEKPPFFATLAGLSNQPLAELDRQSVDPKPVFEGQERAEFFRHIGTNAVTPFQMRQIRQTVTSLPAPDGKFAMSFSSDGEVLLVASKDSVVATRLPDKWKSAVPVFGDAEGQTQQQLWNHELPPIKENAAIQLAIGGGQPAVVAIVRDKQIDLLDAATGKSRASFLAPSNFEYLTAASKANVFLSTDAKGNVFWMNGESTDCSNVGCVVRPASEIESGQSVASNADGSGFVGFSGRQAITCWIEGGRQIASTMSTRSIDHAPVTLVWADNGRNWYDSERIWCNNIETKVGGVTKLFKIQASIWRPCRTWPQSVELVGEHSSITTLGMRRRRDETVVWSIWDTNTYIGGETCGLDLFSDQQLAESSLFDRKQPTVTLSRDASRIGYLDPTAPTPTIQVIYRNPWETPFGQIAYQWMRTLLLDDEYKLDQIDKAGGTILSLDDGMYWGVSQQELYSRIVVEKFGALWSGLEDESENLRRRQTALASLRKAGGNPNAEMLNFITESEAGVANWSAEEFEARMEKLRKLERQLLRAREYLDRWKKSASVTARLCAANREMRLADALIGKDPRTGAPIITDECNLAFKSVISQTRKILAEPQPPVAAFEMLLTASMNIESDILQLEPDLRRCLRLYPNSGSIHRIIGLWLHPEKAGTVGETAAFLETAMGGVDPAFQAQTHSRVGIDLYTEYPKVQGFYEPTHNFFEAKGVSRQRILEGATKYLDENRPSDNQWNVRLITATTGLFSDPAYQNLAVPYYCEFFNYIHPSYYKLNPEILRQRPQPR